LISSGTKITLQHQRIKLMDSYIYYVNKPFVCPPSPLKGGRESELIKNPLYGAVGKKIIKLVVSINQE
jgi:hypothetical protein